MSGWAQLGGTAAGISVRNGGRAIVSGPLLFGFIGIEVGTRGGPVAKSDGDHAVNFDLSA